MTVPPDLSVPLLNMLLGMPAVTSVLAPYKNTFPVFRRRPVPQDTPYPAIVISQNISARDEDSLDGARPVLDRDIAVYGQNLDVASYNAVESIANTIYQSAHRHPELIIVPDWHVMSMVARAPMAAPTDDFKTVGRVVRLTIRLDRKTRD